MVSDDGLYPFVGRQSRGCWESSLELAECTWGPGADTASAPGDSARALRTLAGLSLSGDEAQIGQPGRYAAVLLRLVEMNRLMPVWFV